jgi:hypothetical protein
VAVGVVAASGIVNLGGSNAPGLSLGTNTDQGLVPAIHPPCGEQGKTVASYLQTGSPTSLDQQFASVRADILGKPKEGQPGLIRAQADAVIRACDSQIDQQDAAYAQAQAQAAQQAAEAQAAAAVEAKKQGLCSRVGGIWTTNSATCQVEYVSAADGNSYIYSLAFDEAGDVVPASPGWRNQSECAPSHSGKGRWHADTLICSA